MGFFNSKQKKMAKYCTREQLQRGYHLSEQNLVEASKNGDMKRLKNAMKQHGNFEYALLYKNTPEYRKKCKKKTTYKGC